MRISDGALRQEHQKGLTMKARFIRKLSENTSLFACDPPMMFLTEGHGIAPNEPKTKTSALVVACSGEVAPGYPRVVLHAADLLAGDNGIGYGSMGFRIIDGAENHGIALTFSGYSLDFSVCDAEALAAAPPMLKQ